MAEKDLERDWDLFHKKASESSEQTISPWVCKWASTVPNLDPVILLDEASEELALYERTDPAVLTSQIDWLSDGLVHNLIRRIRSGLKLTGRTTADVDEWDLLRNLLLLPDLTLEGNEPFKDLVDQGLTISLAFKALWQARFLITEGQSVESFVTTLGKWLCGVAIFSEDVERLHQLGIEHLLTTISDRLDVLFMLLTLASQNDLLDRVIVPFKHLDQLITKELYSRKVFTKELYEFLLAADRWGRIEAPVGFIFTYDNPDTVDVLEDIDPLLGRQLKRIKENSR